MNPHVVDRDDVGVVQRPGDPGFLLEAPHQLGAAGQRLVDHLQGDFPAEPAITGSVDLGHPSGTDDGEHLVRAEPATGDQAQDPADSSSKAKSPGASHGRRGDRGAVSGHASSRVATLEAVVANGGEVVQPIGADAPEITARFRDPGGNVLGLYRDRR